MMSLFQNLGSPAFEPPEVFFPPLGLPLLHKTQYDERTETNVFPDRRLRNLLSWRHRAILHLLSKSTSSARGNDGDLVVGVSGVAIPHRTRTLTGKRRQVKTMTYFQTATVIVLVYWIVSSEVSAV